MTQDKYFRFAYLSPVHLLDVAERNFNIALDSELQNGNIDDVLISQTNFAVTCAAAVEAHLNWYFYFDKGIDIDNPKMTSDQKISRAPLCSSTKGGIKAIFAIRNQIMHSKYKPRKAQGECIYCKEVMLMSFKVMVNCCTELLVSCPESLNGRLRVRPSQLEICEHAKSIKLMNSEGKFFDWVAEVMNGAISLPIPSVIDV